MIRRRSKDAGLTLAETIVYAALVALLLLVIVEIAFALSQASRRSRSFLDINSAGVSAFSRFSRDIRRALYVDTVNSTLGASSGKLVLIMPAASGGGPNSSTTFYLSGNRVLASEPDGVAGGITPDSMTVSNLTFRRFVQGTTTAVRVEMTLAPDASTTVPALNFYGTYVLRGSYTQK
jgi:hypothetical protein